MAFLIVFSYLFWRVNRYVKKYREAKKEMDNYQKYIENLQLQNTEVVGQTLRDKIEGITFVLNPAGNSN